jgi:hypothetical protein
MRLEGLGLLKKFNDLVGNRTRDLPSSSIVPQPTVLSLEMREVEQESMNCTQTHTYTCIYIHLYIRKIERLHHCGCVCEYTMYCFQVPFISYGRR